MYLPYTLTQEAIKRMSFHLKNNSIINKSKKRKRDIWKESIMCIKLTEQPVQIRAGDKRLQWEGPQGKRNRLCLNCQETKQVTSAGTFEKTGKHKPEQILTQSLI